MSDRAPSASGEPQPVQPPLSNPHGALSPGYRLQALAAMREESFDVVVIGGGVVGCGVALDAVTRGLSVALVESRDLAAGTSSRSSKLIHGGLRYLEQLDFVLVREALRERALMLERLAPHLVKPLPFLALLRRKVWERGYIGAGLVLYDSMGSTFGRSRGVPGQRHYTRGQAIKRFASLDREQLQGAVQYYDAQVDDARHTMFLGRTAVSYGARLATGVQATGVVRDGDRVTGIEAVDLESGEAFRIRAAHTINATGAWSAEIQQLAGASGGFSVRASKGVHLLVPKDRLEGTTALTIRTETSVLFVIPWGEHWLIGTTDTDWALDTAHPTATRADIDYLLGHVNEYLTQPLTRDDVVGVYAGLRPLIAADDTEGTSELSREHVVAQLRPGLTAVAGGKYTTYRVMAKDAVDAVAQEIDAASSGADAAETPACVTERVALLGAEGYEARWNGRHLYARRHGLSTGQVEHLLNRYGALIDDLTAMIAAEPVLAEPLPGLGVYLAVEARYAVTHEGARHLEDVMGRRLRASMEIANSGIAGAERVAQIMAPPLGWDTAEIEREVAHYRAVVAAHQAAIEELTDAAADAARTAVGDLDLPVTSREGVSSRPSSAPVPPA